MDEFDKTIKESMDEYQPSNTFTDSTMNRLDLSHHHRRWSWKLWGPALAGALAVIAVILIVIPFSGHTNNTSSTTNANVKTPTPSSTADNKLNPSAATQSTSQAAAIPAGTDNTSLDNDLSSVATSINQESSDQSAANSGINDSQQEITIPTD